MQKRISVNLKTEFITDGKKYDGVIQNLSQRGLMVSATTAVKLASKAVVEIHCKLPSDDMLHLHCRVIWYSIKNSSQKDRFSMGLAILNPSMLYNDFLCSLRNSTATFVG